MGASTFSTVSFAATASVAFRDATDNARYECGHGGYTGSIAEKYEFQTFTLPARVSTSKAYRWVSLFITAKYLKNDSTRSWNSDADRKRSARDSVKATAKIPAQHRAWVASIAAISDEKDTPAVCFKMGTTEARAWKKSHGYAGKRGDVFFFFGTASC